jgi:hypothetical protein
VNSKEFKLQERFFVAYVGHSMNPTLREPELLEIVPYSNRPMEAGDVVFFQSLETHQPIVHRMVRLTPEGIATRGDNNSQEDHCLLNPGDILGRVAAAWRGSKRRDITGGRRGLWISRGLQWKARLDRGGSYLLHPFYHALAKRGYFARIVPNGLRPRVVIFKINGQNQPGLFIRKHLVGRYDDRLQQWQIRRPFRLLVNVNRLPTVPS